MSQDPDLPRAPAPAALAGHRPGEDRLTRLTRAVSAAHVLSDALWEALREQLDDGSESGDAGGVSSISAERVSKISERLGDVAATVALLADERAEAGAPPATASPAKAPVASAQPAAAPMEALSAHAPLGSAHAAAPPTPAAPEAGHGHAAAAVQSEERMQSPIAPIERALEQLERDRPPCAAMLVELAHADHARAAPPADASPSLSAQIEDAFVQTLQQIAVGLDGRLIRERLGRYWLLLPETDRLGAQKLIGRLADAARDASAAAATHAQVAAGAAAEGGAATDAQVAAGAAAEGVAATDAQVAAGADTEIAAGGNLEGGAGADDLAERYFAALSQRTSARRAGRRAVALQLVVGIAACPEDGRGAKALATHAALELDTRVHTLSVRAGTVT